MSQVNTFARNKVNKLILNPRKLDVQFFQLAPDAPNNPVAVAASATSAPVQLTVSQDGPFEAMSATLYRLRTDTGVESALDAFVDIYDEGSKRSLMNRAIHVDNLFGRSITGMIGVANARAGIAPGIFAETLFIHQSRTLTMRLINGSAAAQQNFYPVLNGTRWYGYANPSKELAIAVEKRASRARISTPYWYTTDADAVALGAGLNTNLFLTVTGEGHFEWWKLVYVSNVDFTMQVTDKRNGRQFSNGPIHCKAGMGTAALPYILPEATVIQANGQLQFNITNLAGAATLTAYIALIGRRIYVG